MFKVKHLLICLFLIFIPFLSNCINIKKVNSSSYLEEKIKNKQIKYLPDYLIDNDIKTSWVEGSKGFGEGEWIEIILEKESYIKALSFYNGFARDVNSYFYNSRPDEIDIILDDNEKRTFYLDDFYNIELFYPIYEKVKKIKIVIKSIYAGTKYKDTAISEIKIYGNELSDKKLEDNFCKHFYYPSLFKSSILSEDIYSSLEKKIIKAFHNASIDELLLYSKDNNKQLTPDENESNKSFARTFLIILGVDPEKNLKIENDRILNKLSSFLKKHKIKTYGEGIEFSGWFDYIYGLFHYNSMQALDYLYEAYKIQDEKLGGVIGSPFHAGDEYIIYAKKYFAMKYSLMKKKNNLYKEFMSYGLEEIIYEEMRGYLKDVYEGKEEDLKEVIKFYKSLEK